MLLQNFLVGVVYAGVNLAKDIKVKKLLVERDSWNIINYLKGKAKLSWKVTGILQNILQMLESFEEYGAGHVLREGNSAADWLANWGTFKEEDKRWTP